MGTYLQQSSRRRVEHRHRPAEVESRLSKKGWSRDEARRSAARGAAQSRPLVEAYLQALESQRLCADGLPPDERRPVLPARSQSESADRNGRRFLGFRKT